MGILNSIEGPSDLKRLTPEAVRRLAGECREVIIRTITARGGHLASNLGVVELTLALHRSFDSPRDRVVWDTSNQCYTHKLVTGRRDRFATIRQPGGLSGFAEPMESEHDTLAAGHAGTGLSYALGMAAALKEDPPFVVTVVGDGALTSGLSYEALNNVVHIRPRRFIIVFNDNGWSISENVGWLARLRNQVVFDPRWKALVARGRRLFDLLPGGDAAWAALRRLKTYVKGLLAPSLVWEEVGLHYLGPVDGHDLVEMERAFDRAKGIADVGTPVVLHVRTQKGRGFAQAEDNPVRFHQPSSPLAAAGTLRPTYTQVFARTLIQLMEADPRVMAISAAMLEGTGLAEVRRSFPERVFDVGIAESHAVTMAAGMAKAGLKPVVCIYSTFLQRSYDQVLHDVALQSLPVVFAIDRAGFVGDDGKTHHGLFDVAFLRPIPNLVVAAPKDEGELPHLLLTALRSGRPFALRWPRGPGNGAPLPATAVELPIGRAEPLRAGSDLALLAYGAMVEPALEAAEALARRGVSAGVVNARFAKPLDRDALKGAAEAAPRILTVEEHMVAGGFGSAVLEAAQEMGLVAAVRCHGVRDRFVEHAPQAVQRRQEGLDPEGIARAVLRSFPELADRAKSPESVEAAAASAEQSEREEAVPAAKRRGAAA